MRVYDLLVDAMAWLAALLILAIMIGVGVDVFARFALNSPVGWMYEFVQHSLLSILFLGSPWLARQNGHVAIDILVRMLPQRLAGASQVLGFAVAAATSGFIGYWALAAALEDYGRGIMTVGIYPVPRSVLLFIIALGLLLTAVEFVRLLVKAAQGRLPSAHEVGPG